MIGLIIKIFLRMLEIKSFWNLIFISTAINLVISITQKRTSLHFIMNTIISTTILCVLYKKYENKSNTKKWYILIHIVDYIVDMII